MQYTLREDLKNLIVCLYCPYSETDGKFTTDTMWNYISDCKWQIMDGQQITRFPYHLTKIVADAEQAEDDLRRRLAELRKDAIAQEKKAVKPNTEQRYSWGWSGGKQTV